MLHAKLQVISVPKYSDPCCASGMAALWLSALCRNKIPYNYELCPKLHKFFVFARATSRSYVPELCTNRVFTVSLATPTRSQLRDLELIITNQSEGHRVADLQFIGGTEPRPTHSEAADRLLAKRSRCSLHVPWHQRAV